MKGTPAPAISLHRDASLPAYRDLYQRVRSEILSGRLAPGARLPSSRTLATQLGIARGTVEIAYQMLAGEGYTVGDGARGTIVNPALPRSRKPIVAAATSRAAAERGAASAAAAEPAPVPDGVAGVRCIPAQAMGADRHADRATAGHRAVDPSVRRHGSRAAAACDRQLPADRPRHLMLQRANSRDDRLSGSAQPDRAGACSSPTTRSGSKIPVTSSHTTCCASCRCASSASRSTSKDWMWPPVLPARRTRRWRWSRRPISSRSA